jgi:hypothetical protein
MAVANYFVTESEVIRYVMHNYCSPRENDKFTSLLHATNECCYIYIMYIYLVMSYINDAANIYLLSWPAFSGMYRYTDFALLFCKQRRALNCRRANRLEYDDVDVLQSIGSTII